METASGNVRKSKAATTLEPAAALEQRTFDYSSQTKPRFHRHFTDGKTSPLDAVTWELRTCAITNDSGKTVFEQKDVEVPAFWSQMAINVVASKYFHGDLDGGGREHSIRALITRVVNTIAEQATREGRFVSQDDEHIFRDELTYILLHQLAAFNSPVWFNVGVRAHPQCSACFIISVEDSIDGLLELQGVEARLFKYGSGTGTNLSSIRSSREALVGGGKPSGPVSFMRGFDAWAGTIKSGGKTRRAAKMQILNATHPDIKEFINCKVTEERKAWALIDQGYDGGFAVPGGAYDSVSFQNANLSVRAPDEFMRAAESGDTYATKRVTDGKVCERLNATEVLREIAEATHLCGDPGMQFDDTINAWHTCPNSGRINASNPCSEYMHLDDSACNLSSINLLKFLRPDSSFDVEGFRQVVRIMLSAQDCLIDVSSYPTKKIENCARSFRQLGLGYANLGALLMSLGLPYDSVEGRDMAAGITALMTGEAYCASARMARDVGAFGGYRKNRIPMLKVLEKHRTAARQLSAAIPQALREAAVASWNQAVELCLAYGCRNSQVTVLAPTGTISFMMDCDTTGIEPDIALTKYKKLVGGGVLKLINNSVSRALEKLGYSEDARKQITEWIAERDTIEGAPGLKDSDLAVFDCALKPQHGQRCIQYRGHLSMMAAVQPFISGAISKTVNLPSEVTAEEIAEIYLDAWRLGLKAVALYRDGSKRTQPLSTSSSPATRSASQPVRRRLPDERQALTHKFRVGGLEGYLTVGLYEDNTPGEIFLVVAKEGSTLSGIMDAFATSISIALQYGVPLEALVKKFAYVRFEPSGFTANKDVPIAHSIVDYVFRWLAVKFLTPEKRLELGLKVTPSASEGAPAAPKLNKPAGHNGNGNHATSTQRASNQALAAFENSLDAPPCLNCGSHLMVRQAGCYVCLNCGTQGGCG